ncbi:hypothetical protein GP486_000199 [Trichoglossum hirsutum]|uniref:Uncharacterized protein n=1 Tax=Trichoglossum hirsutum TaxID=265104 RepID=A0A9P8RTW3_9PEZI|nr:hypothetical protein GP486_000199 [Trichoglossum hirsutum]
MSYPPPYIPNPNVPSSAPQASGYQPVTFEVPGPAQAHQYHNYASYHPQYQQVPTANLFQECQQPAIQQRQVQELPVLQRDTLQPPHKSAVQFPTPTTPATVTPTPEPLHDEVPPLDYQLILISLAEDYFAAAHRQGSLLALSMRAAELDRYYKLIASGLACLETVLKARRGLPLGVRTLLTAEIAMEASTATRSSREVATIGSQIQYPAPTS